MRLALRHLKAERKWQKKMEVCSAWLDYQQFFSSSICIKVFAGMLCSFLTLLCSSVSLMKFIFSCTLMAETKAVLCPCTISLQCSLGCDELL